MGEAVRQSVPLPPMPAGPLEVWTRPLGEVLPPSPALGRYFAEVWQWQDVRRDPARLRALFRTEYTAVGEVSALLRA